MRLSHPVEWTHGSGSFDRFLIFSGSKKIGIYRTRSDRIHPYAAAGELFGYAAYQTFDRAFGRTIWAKAGCSKAYQRRGNGYDAAAFIVVWLLAFNFELM
jgi:hypothetical protein